MPGSRPQFGNRVTLLLAMAALASLPASGQASPEHSSALRIGPIEADFVESARQTVYSVEIHERNPSAPEYQWTLKLEAVDPDKPVDEGCTNRGFRDGTDATFAWRHGNKGDPVSDDGCLHEVQGKYGHQGLISVEVKDGERWKCTATYKGTLSSEAAPSDAASEPVCQGPTTSPPPPAPPPAPPPPPPKPKPKPCKCMLLTARIVPTSFRTESRIEEGVVSRRTVIDVSYALHWVMNCSQGSGSRCRGRLVVQTESVDKWNPKDIHIDCKGRCGGVEDGVQTIGNIRGFSRDQLAGQRIPIVVHRTCQGKALRPIKLRLAFDKVGRPDREKSKLR